MLILSLLKALRDDVRSPQWRFDYVNALLRGLPGSFGMALRSRVVPRYFANAGRDVAVYQGVRLDGVAKISVGDRVRIGVDNHFQAAGGLSIGHDTIFGPGVKIWTINHRYDSVDRPIVEQGWNFRAVSIGAHCWIGAHVFIQPGVEIPDGCIVSAGTVVGVKRYAPYSIVAGHPARVIGNRLAGDGTAQRDSNGDVVAVGERGADRREEGMG
jgi:acetyltransferase-like isoleucine patch superfamily enzyme